MKNVKKPYSDIAQVRYTPPESYRLDLEVFSIAERAKEVKVDSFRGTHRIDFHMLICVISGKFTHTVDFTPVPCEPGSVLTLRPAQTQRFDTESKWDAWIVMFRPELLLPLQATVPTADLKSLGNLEALPVHFSLSDADRHAVTESIMQMHRDARINAPSPDLNALLRHQLYALLLRLNLIQRQQEVRDAVPPMSLQRFKRFQGLVEKNFAAQHQLGHYARLLGISEKSLTRASLDAVGMTAKTFVASRVNLEAKRLLTQTALPVSVIADQVGFDEATNFVKFFKREVGCSPGEFRRRHAR